MVRHFFVARALWTGVVLSVLSAHITGATAATERILYAFGGGTDGASPESGLVLDDAGNLYGTTLQGGVFHGCYGGGCGTVFSVAADGTFTTLHEFAGEEDGAFPEGGLLADGDGNLYGTTIGGGKSNCSNNPACGNGTVFSVAANGTKSTLYSFESKKRGAEPFATLIMKNGSLFGTTVEGGNTGCAPYYNGCGTVFKVTVDGREYVLYSFTGGSDGANPYYSLLAIDGVLFGTTPYGGNPGCDGGLACGTVFKVDGHTETVLYSFTGGSDGANPSGPLVADKAGNLYGTTGLGGSGCGGIGCGVVFKLAPNGTETVLYAFAGGVDGQGPEGGLVRDKSGNLYGTTGGGGTGCSVNGCGTVFKLSPDGTETVLHAFTGGSDGAIPAAGVIRDKSGNLYGTTVEGGGHCGGSGCGTVFMIKP